MMFWKGALSFHREQWRGGISAAEILTDVCGVHPHGGGAYKQFSGRRAVQF